MADAKLDDALLTGTRAHDRTETPRFWRVLLHNDDFTTQEFVVWILETVFHKPHGEAVTTMMRVHQTGMGVAGLFTRDVAETKVNTTKRLAEEHQFPLLVTFEQEPEGART